MSLRNSSIPGDDNAAVIESLNFATRFSLTSSTDGSCDSTSFCRVTRSMALSR